MENGPSGDEMSWQKPQPALYVRPHSTESAAADRAGKAAERPREDYSMDEYRMFVRGVADGPWPSETILNRSADHAAVIIENLFRKSEHQIEILTSELKRDVYATSGVIEAAIDFLRRNDDGELRILSETKLDRNSHPFFAAIEAAQLAERVKVGTIPANQQDYKFNFAVADAKSFRFEESRDSFEAIVGFGHEKFANRLHIVFGTLATLAA